MKYPSDFIFGAATSAYQCEGGWNADGKGLSVWDVFSQQPGNITDSQTGNVACESYFKTEEDVRLLKNLGVTNYRFSVSWSRVLPEGMGKINRAGIDYYKRLIESLGKAGIGADITLYHWDMPYALHLKGGLLNREFSDWFAEYAYVLAGELGGAASFSTFNEPQCIVGAGYGNGAFAPGLKMAEPDLVRIVHNLLLSHGKGVEAVRSQSKAKIGFVSCRCGAYPVRRNEKAIDYAKKEYFSARDGIRSLTVYNDPVFLGRYPQEYVNEHPVLEDVIKADDMRIIAADVDFCGHNVYTGYPVDWNEENDSPVVVQRDPGYRKNDCDWDVDENSLYWSVRFLAERYKKPVRIMENGTAVKDFVYLDGKVHDGDRIDYLARYLAQAERLINEKYPLEGYYHWSLLDNFEWQFGYTKRFGLVFCDYATGNRMPKDSYYWYKNYIDKAREK